MSDNDRELLESVWSEARDLIKRLEGSSVQRFAVEAGTTRIEIERGAPAAMASSANAAEAGAPQALISGGLSVAPESRGASGAFSVGDMVAADNRIPVLAPLVGTFYRSGQPGSKPFVEVGDTVDSGQTVCIVEAMKLMNEVAASEGGRVAEICVENGEPVEFDQVLMYLEPAE